MPTNTPTPTPVPPVDPIMAALEQLRKEHEAHKAGTETALAALRKENQDLRGKMTQVQGYMTQLSQQVATVAGQLASPPPAPQPPPAPKKK
jgi:hypothetical protein